MTVIRGSLLHAPAWSCLLLVLACGTIGNRVGSEVRGLGDDLRNPFNTSTAEILVLVFVTSDCPIANRYAPELTRIYRRYRDESVDFHLVYPDPSLSAGMIRAHRKEYSLPMPAVRDPRHDLVRLTGATRTPEAAVYRRSGGGFDLAYRGRIDDRFVDFGKTRASATQHDLDDAIRDILAGREVTTARTRAIGCYLENLLP